MDKQTTDTVKCPQCQSDISALAKKCPNCRSAIRKPMSNLIKVFLVVLLVSPILIAIVSDTGSEPTPRPIAETVYPSTYAEDYVLNILKSPSTADFCDAATQDLGDNRFRVTSCVDSQNGFGATIRSSWEVVMVYSGASREDLSNPQSWKPESIVFDGEKVL